MADTPRPADVLREHWMPNAVRGGGGYCYGCHRYYDDAQGHLAGLLATPPADVTEQAREEAERRYAQGRYVAGDHIEGFVAGAEWAAARHTSEAEAGARALDEAADPDVQALHARAVYALLAEWDATDEDDNVTRGQMADEVRAAMARACTCKALPHSRRCPARAAALRAGGAG